MCGNLCIMTITNFNVQTLKYICQYKSYQLQYRPNGGEIRGIMLQVIAVIHYNLFQQIFGTTLLSFFINLAFIVIVFVILYRLILASIINKLLDTLDYLYLKKGSVIFLELTPPSHNNKDSNEVAQLFSSIYGLTSKVGVKDKLLRRRKIVSLELVSTKRDGIRYVAGLSKDYSFLFKQLLESFMPEIKIKEIPDHLPRDLTNTSCQIVEFGQSAHYAYPLTTKTNDVLSFITGAMVSPADDEIIALQLVTSPVDLATSSKIRKKLLAGKDGSINHHKGFWIFRLIRLVLVASVTLVDIILHFIFRDSKYCKTSKTPSLSSNTKHVINSVYDKLDQPLFYVDIRVLAIGDNYKERIKALSSALSLFNVPGYQEIVVRRNTSQSYAWKYKQDVYSGRLPSILTSGSSVLSSQELASIYQFPSLGSGSNEVVTSLSKVLPVPLAIKNRSSSDSLDVIYGVNHYHDKDNLVGLTKEERQRHVYILGGSGNGKTTMIKSAIISDIKAGKGVAVIDPHGDLAESILRYIPEDRIKDVIYFNPRDIAHPIGLNLLEQPKGLSEDDLLLEQDFITEAVISVFRKIFSDDDHGGHRIEHFLRNTIHTAFTVPDATLFTVYKLLTNTTFRRSVVDKLTDEDLKDFWAGEFNSAGDYQKVKMSSGVNAKLGRFQRSVVSRRILEQTKSTIDFDDIIQNNKILICNFAKGHIGEDTSSLLGISVLAKLQLSALRRARLGEDSRTPFYLYVDEFQNFATISFVQLLSEARKYKLFLTMAEQSTAQQEEKRLVDIMLANVGTVICFRSGSPQDEKLLLPIFKPQLGTGDLANLPSYNFYMRLRAVSSLEPMSGETILLEDSGSDELAQRVVEVSRDKYTKLYVKPEDKVKYNPKSEVKQSTQLKSELTHQSLNLDKKAENLNDNYFA